MMPNRWILRVWTVVLVLFLVMSIVTKDWLGAVFLAGWVTGFGLLIWTTRREPPTARAKIAQLHFHGRVFVGFAIWCGLRSIVAGVEHELFVGVVNAICMIAFIPMANGFFRGAGSLDVLVTQHERLVALHEQILARGGDPMMRGEDESPLDHSTNN